VLHGRDGERAAIARLVDDARASRGGTLILRGHPGVGKSALVEDAVARSDGMLVLTTQGVESEVPLAFAALHRLLRPILPYSSRLPAPQRAALEGALGNEVGAGADRFLVFVASLSLLAEAAEDTPILCSIDDAHWLDDASAAALLFVARRLQAERIALLFAAREGDVRVFEAEGLPSVDLKGIGPDAAGELLAEVAGSPVSSEVRDRLLVYTGGNPLALVELPTVLSSGQLDGSLQLPSELRLTERVEQVFLDRSRRLPQEAQTLLLVAAADDSLRWSTVRAAATVLGCGMETTDAVERSGLLHMQGSDLEWRHPLVRSAIYQGATSLQRQQAHHALADVLVATGDTDRRAWHMAAASDPPDDALADALEAAGARSLDRGGYEAASAALQRAADFTSADAVRAQRLTAAATNAWLAGQSVRARHLTTEAKLIADDPLLRSDIDRLRGRIEFNDGSLTVGIRILTRGAREVAGHDQQRSLEMFMIASALATFATGPDTQLDLAELAARADRDPPRTRLYADLLAGFTHVACNDMTGAAPRLHEALRLGADLTETDLLTNMGIAAFYLGDDEAFHRCFTRLLSQYREASAVGLVLFALPRLGLADLVSGEWSLYAAHATEALQLARSTGQPGLTPMPLAELTMIAALRGDDAYDSLLAEAQLVTSGEPVGVLGGLTRDVILWSMGLREASAGQHSSALHHLEQMSHQALVRLAALDRIEAAIRVGQKDLANRWADDLEEFAQATGASWAAAVVAHARALLADTDATDQLFLQALELHSKIHRPFERARCALAYGEHLRRTRRRVDAREHVRAALHGFEDLGAEPWAERAVQELRASGETARKRDPATASDLTPQELQVARFVSRGLSNRDVAAQLFLSPRTIDFHLRNVFTKTGVSSRGELARLDLG
jgi:DNA-binding CsgD family transcriptional regulator